MPAPSLQLTYYIVAISGIVVTALIPSGIKVVKWVYKQVRHAEETRDFVVALHDNHIPHCLHALELICDKLGIELTEPPSLPKISKE